MAKSEKAATAIAAHFHKAPGASLDEFLEVGVRADKSLAGIGRRSFNATYMLPLKRAANPTPARKRRPAARRKATAASGGAKQRRRGAAAISAAARSAARDLVLGRDQKVLSALESGGDPVAAYRLGADVDGYIDQLAAALKK